MILYPSFGRMTNDSPKLISLDTLIKSTHNIREHVDQKHVQELAEAIASGTQVPPIEVRPENGKYGVIDGLHRWNAHARLGRTHILAYVRNISDADALCRSVQANASKNNSKDELMATAYRMWEKGVPIDEISKKVPGLNGKVKEFLDIYHCCHPKLRANIIQKIGVVGASWLIRFPVEDQLALFEEGQKAGDKKTFFKTKADERHLKPRHLPKTAPRPVLDLTTVTPDPVPMTIDTPQVYTTRVTVTPYEAAQAVSVLIKEYLTKVPVTFGQIKELLPGLIND